MPEPVDPPESQKEAETDRPSSPLKDADEESQKKTVWVFGYDSLMWDNWETGHGCLRHVVAVFPGFRRTFNKASVNHWGTKDKPCPTFNLAADPLDFLPGRAGAQVRLARPAVIVPTQGVTQKVERLFRQAA